MTYLSTETIAEIEAEIVTYKALLLETNAAYSGALAAGIKSYKFDGGDSEASQQATRHDTKEMLANINAIRAIIKNLEDRLACAGINTIKMRRG